jgi:hypothetical protein
MRGLEREGFGKGGAPSGAVAFGQIEDRYRRRTNVMDVWSVRFRAKGS